MFTFSGHVKTLELHGTENQVRWARTIRSQRAAALDKLGPSGIGRSIREVVKKHSEDLTKAGVDTELRANQFCTAAGMEMLASTDAQEWITNKAAKVDQMISEAAERVAVEWSAFPPSWTPRS